MHHMIEICCSEEKILLVISNVSEYVLVTTNPDLVSEKLYDSVQLETLCERYDHRITEVIYINTLLKDEWT